MSIPSNRPAGCVSVIEYPVASDGREIGEQVVAVDIGLHRHIDRVAQVVDTRQGHIHTGNTQLAGVLDTVVVEILEHRTRQRRRRQLTKVIPRPGVTRPNRNRRHHVVHGGVATQRPGSVDTVQQTQQVASQ